METKLVRWSVKYEFGKSFSAFVLQYDKNPLNESKPPMHAKSQPLLICQQIYLYLHLLRLRLFLEHL